MEAALVPTEPSTVDLPAQQLTTLVEHAVQSQDIDALKDVASMATALQAGAKARNMGIEQENKAAEVVLRAERGLGTVLLAMRDEGTLASPGASPRQWTSRDATSVKTLRDLGLGSGTDRNRVAMWQKLARMTDEQFENRLTEMRTQNERIARLPFLRPEQRRTAPEPERPGLREFQAFRAGAHALVAWEVGEDGTGRSLSNLLGHLTDDELAQIKALVEAIAGRYGETVKARRAH